MKTRVAAKPDAAAWLAMSLFFSLALAQFVHARVQIADQFAPSYLLVFVPGVLLLLPLAAIADYMGLRGKLACAAALFLFLLGMLDAIFSFQLSFALAVPLFLMAYGFGSISLAGLLPGFPYQKRIRLAVHHCSLQLLVPSLLLLGQRFWTRVTDPTGAFCVSLSGDGHWPGSGFSGCAQ